MDLILRAVLIFGFAFISNVSPFIGASYTLLAALQLREIGLSLFNFGIVVAASAVGATLAKVAIYYGAFGLRKYLVRNKNIQLIGRSASSEKFYVALFLTALLPVLPLDDFLYIGAGAEKASLPAMGGVTLGAKLAKSAVEIPIEFTILKEIVVVFGFSNVYATAGLMLVFLVIGVLLYKVDWQKQYRRLRMGRAKPAETSA